MKTYKKILILLYIIIIAVGMFILGRNGLTYIDGYSKEFLLNSINDYLLYIIISTIIIIGYFALRYRKQGVIKTIGISIIGILAVLIFALAVIAISRMQINRLFSPIMLSVYASSIIIITSFFEEKNNNFTKIKNP